ncbi:MAG TPA: hypothetical protein VJ301_11535 [Propionibacteriaceae bacterium]|nr:hypothetical protein [Propionibacteriaceae bacterium]
MAPCPGARRALELQLPPGLSEWAVHPGLADGASRKIDDGWKVRSTDLEFSSSREAREAVRHEGIMIIDYSAIKDAWSRQGLDDQAGHRPPR